MAFYERIFDVISVVSACILSPSIYLEFVDSNHIVGYSWFIRRHDGVFKNFPPMFAVHGLVPFTDVSANGAVVEEDEIFFGCYGHYYGGQSPRLYWSRTNSIPNGIAGETRVPGRKFWEGRKSGGIELGVHYNTLTTTVKREMHGFMYKCATGDYYDNQIDAATKLMLRGAIWSRYRPRAAVSYTFQPLVVYCKCP